METSLRLVRNLVTEIRRTVEDGVTVDRVDVLATLGERILRAFVLIIAVNRTDTLERTLISMQQVVNNLNRIASSLEDENFEPYGYHPTISFTGRRGRPKVVINRGMLDYFFSHGFSATTTAMLLHVSLSTLRRRMCECGIQIRDRYSDVSNQELDRMVTLVQHRNPNCGYRMMQGYLARLGHKVQQTRVREAMSRTDPEGIVSRWCYTVQRRCYSVSTPNALWHIDGHHRLIRYIVPIYFNFILSSVLIGGGL